MVQPKLTSLGLLQVIRTEESQNSSLILVISLLTLGAGGSKTKNPGKIGISQFSSEILLRFLVLVFFYSGAKKLHAFGTGLLYVGTVLLEPAPLPSLEDVLQEEETREEA